MCQRQASIHCCPDFLGCIRVDLARHRNRDGLHGWFPLLNAEEKQVAGSGYAHVKVAMHDATLSAGLTCASALHMVNH